MIVEDLFLTVIGSARALSNINSKMNRGELSDYNSCMSSGVSGGEKVDRISEDLCDRIDKLIITCQAMWEIIKENSDLQDEDLIAKIQEIDLRDGTEDGKITIQIAKCKSCGRTLSRKHNKCLYCGDTPNITNIFSTI